MKKLLTLLTFSFLLTLKSIGQNIDSLQLIAKEIPEGYVLTNENRCISIQARTFYNNPGMYEMFIGKLKSKQVQNFESQKDQGSILYFEFEEDFKGMGFLEGLLWGGDKPTPEHPEEFFAKGKFLIIWSFKKGSVIRKVSGEKVEAAFK